VTRVFKIDPDVKDWYAHRAVRVWKIRLRVVQTIPFVGPATKAIPPNLKFVSLTASYGNSLSMLGQNAREAPNFVKGIVEGSGCDADNVRLAEIAFHTSGFEFAEQLFRVFVR
jgi:hypothetical protein